jgi:uncharacterized C2H2 Zn-finger protein
MIYKCDKCLQEFKFNSQYIRHINKKISCINNQSFEKIINTISININNYETNILKLDDKINNIENTIKIKISKSIENEKKCIFCEHKFKNKGNILRHINTTCIILKTLYMNKNKIILEKTKLIDEKNKLIEDKNKLIEDKKQQDRDNEIKILRKQIEKLLQRKSHVINQTINQTINPTINNTRNSMIVINAFGKEDLSHLKIQDYIKYLNNFFPGFVGYIEKVHFDDDAPQNHNIYISNLRSKYISIHDGEKWITKDKNDIIDNLILKKHNQLSSICEELEEKNQISKKIVKNFEEFCESFKNKDAQKTIKNNILTMLYDNNNKIKSLKKIL